MLAFKSRLWSPSLLCVPASTLPTESTRAARLASWTERLARTSAAGRGCLHAASANSRTDAGRPALPVATKKLQSPGDLSTAVALIVCRLCCRRSNPTPDVGFAGSRSERVENAESVLLLLHSCRRSYTASDGVCDWSLSPTSERPSCRHRRTSSSHGLQRASSGQASEPK